MDRNTFVLIDTAPADLSLSARRAWIEIVDGVACRVVKRVALRKESVDRNGIVKSTC